jgi:hypothetical protein
MARLHQYYQDEVVPKLREQLGYRNVMEVPRLVKITLNMGVGEAVGDKKVLDNAQRDMALIAGQKPIVTHARKSIAGFKIRQGWIDWSTSPFRGFAIFAASVPALSMGAAITAWGCASRSSFRRSTTIRSMPCAAWILPLPPRPVPMRKGVPCWRHLIFHLEVNQRHGQEIDYQS